jgi:hypothetical protein
VQQLMAAKKDDNVHVNVILRGACITTAAVQSKDYCIFWVCVYNQLPSMQYTCTILYCHLWHVCLYHNFPHYLIDRKIFWTKLLKIMIFLKHLSS